MRDTHRIVLALLLFLVAGPGLSPAAEHLPATVASGPPTGDAQTVAGAASDSPSSVLRGRPWVLRLVGNTLGGPPCLEVPQEQLANSPTQQVAQTLGVADRPPAASLAQGDAERQLPTHANKQLTLVFAPASSKSTGQGKWQAGPAAVAGFLSKAFLVGAFPHQSWSIGKSTDRPFTSQLQLQPFAAWFFASGWTLGYSGDILTNWMGPSRDVWTLPLGPAIGKVVTLGPLPVKFQIAKQYVVQRPRDTGQEWNIQFQITPLLPKHIKGALFE